MMYSAKVELFMRYPLFYAVLSTLAFEEDASVGTMAVSPRRLVYNGEFFRGLSLADQVFCLAHEALHRVLKFHDRLEGLDVKLFNIAQDLVINEALLADPYFADVSLKSNIVTLDWARRKVSRNFSYDSQVDTSESVYHRLAAYGVAQAQAQPVLGNCVAVDGEAVDEAEGIRIGALLDHYGKDGIGSVSLPGSLKVDAADRYPSSPDYRAVLRQHFYASAPSDYSRSPVPMIPYGMFGVLSHSLNEPALESVAIILDTSGSMLDEMAAVAAEVAAVLADTQPQRCIRIDADSEVCHVIEGGPQEVIESLQGGLVGGRGTCFAAGLARAEKFEPSCAVYITDGKGSYPSEAPTYPLLWVLVNKSTAPPPFGDYVYVA